MNVTVDGITFRFPAKFEFTKFDDWAFYRNQFSRMWNGIKAIDLIALGTQTTWLIEVKDYRTNRRTKPSDIGVEVGEKVFSTLAALLPARCNANKSEEQEFARKALASRNIKVVLHLEQPRKHSKLFPRAIDPANVQLKLRSLVKPIDPHPLVVESSEMGSCPWSVV